MPIYEYQCTACKHQFSDLFKSSERLVATQSPCPSCNASNVEILISTGAHVFDVEGRKPKGDFKEMMKRVKSNFKYDRQAKSALKDY